MAEKKEKCYSTSLRDICADLDYHVRRIVEGGWTVIASAPYRADPKAPWPPAEVELVIRMRTAEDCRKKGDVNLGHRENPKYPDGYPEEWKKKALLESEPEKPADTEP